MAPLHIIDWVTPEALVLSLVGDLEASSCHAIGARLRQLLAQWPGIAVTVDLAGVTAADQAALEDLCLDLVANRYRGGALHLACPSAACLPTLVRLNAPYIPQLSPVRSLAGVTA